MAHSWLESSKFEQRYIPEPNTGCWLWTAGLMPDGYGTVFPTGHRGKQWRAHRLAYVLFRGDIPKGMQVLHRCDTRACVNPDHLFLGTPRDNIHDMLAKGRDTIVGERNSRAKLSEAQVKAIRLRGMKEPVDSLAREFGITKSHLRRIVQGLAWASLG
jgi:hypothetical protein